MSNTRWVVQSAPGGGFVLKNADYPGWCTRLWEYAGDFARGALFYADHGYQPRTAHGARRFETAGAARGFAVEMRTAKR